ncbi:MAG: MerR family transcriptional regulator [Phreatobacter sp.]|nr:MerR family transcriptional regulator [Phreatobacter sp.]
MDKAPDAYRTISEVADDLDLPQHVLRFWETRFAQIKPLKRGGGRRYYRPEDIDLLKGIRHLLYGEGYTIRGVQRIIKESGVKAIQALGRGEGAAGLPKPKGPEIIGSDMISPGASARGAMAEDEIGPDDAADADMEPDEPAAPAQHGLRSGLKGLFRGERADPVRPPLALDAEPAGRPLGGDNYGERPFAAFRREPVLDGPVRREAATADARASHAGEAAGSETRAAAGAADFRAPARPAAAPEMAHRAAEVASPPEERRMPSQAAEPAPAQPASRRLSADDVRRLQAAIYELTECRKRLDQAIVVR